MKCFSIASGVWLQALLLYSLFTLPMLVEPIVYAISLTIAIGGSLPGLYLLGQLLWLLDRFLRGGSRRFGWTAGFMAGEELVSRRAGFEFRLLALGGACLCATISYLFSSRRIRILFKTAAS